MQVSKLLMGTTLALGAGLAQAQVNAAFQVTSFSVVASGGTLSWLSGSAYQSLAVTANEAGGLGGSDLADRYDFALVDAALAAGVAHAGASAGVTATGTLSGSAAAQQFNVSPFSQPHFASSMAQQSGEFSLSAAGSVSFTVNYLIDVSAVNGDNFYSYAQASLGLDAGNYGNDSGGSSFAELLSFDFSGHSGQQAGSFTLTVALAGPDDVGFYNLRGNSYASASAVPEPGSWALMLAGMVAVAGLLRRRAQ